MPEAKVVNFVPIWEKREPPTSELCSARRAESTVSTRFFAKLFLRGDQLAVLDLDVANVIWQLQTVALFGKFLLQRAADH
jgi:hypothetical protein